MNRKWVTKVKSGRFSTWGLSLERPEIFSDLKSEFSDCNPLVLKSWSFNLLCMKNREDCEVWWLRPWTLLRFNRNCGTRNKPERRRDIPLVRVCRSMVCANQRYSATRLTVATQQTFLQVSQSRYANFSNWQTRLHKKFQHATTKWKLVDFN